MSKLVTCFMFVCLLLFGSCIQKNTESEQTAWQTVLKEKLPLLGHRNWIVVTDMAYPLQAKKGITTLYAQESYVEVLSIVKRMLDNSPHVYAHVYQDKELSYLDDSLCMGIDRLKAEMGEVIHNSNVKSVEHDRLIATLDSISGLYDVIVIKTNMQKPYTSIFFELDCKYWNNDKQVELNKKMCQSAM